MLLFFQLNYRWRPQYTETVRGHFDHLLQGELKQMMSNAKRAHSKSKGTKWPAWATANLRQQMENLWSSPEFQAKSQKNKINRLKERIPGEGPHTHNTGSQPFSAKKKKMVNFYQYLLLFYNILKIYNILLFIISILT